jgi:hypothetical protein
MYTASCHCGAVMLEMQKKPRKLTACNCSLCRRYGALWGYFQRKSLRVVAEKRALETYAWKDKRLKFFRCKKCGSVTHYERAAKEAGGADTAAVNFRNIDEPGLIADIPIRLLDGASSWKVLDEGPQPYLLRSPGSG